MLIENKGIRRADFQIPPFDLRAGEIVVIYLFSGQHFYDIEMLLIDVLSGKTKDENVIVHKSLTFVGRFTEPKLRRLFYPLTVEEYLKKNADLSSPWATKIYETKWINRKTKINTLAGNERRLLGLYVTLSKTRDIIFDLVGQGPIEAANTYGIVKEVVAGGGSAVLLDCFDEMKNDCTKYIELQWLNMFIEL